MYRSGFISGHRPDIKDSYIENYESVKKYLSSRENHMLYNRTSENNIESFFTMDPCAFSGDIIQIYKFYHEHKLDFIDPDQFAKITEVRKLVLFRNLEKACGNATQRILLQEQIKQYLDAILKTFCVGGTQNTIATILTLAEFKIRLDHVSSLNNLGAVHVKVELPKIVAPPLLQTPQDIINLIKVNLSRHRLELISIPTQQHKFIPGETIVHYDGPFLNSVIEQLINYEQFLIGKAKESGIQMEPYTKKI